MWAFELTMLAFMIGLAIVMPAIPARAQTTWTIEMTDYQFTPKSQSINAGDHVVWHNGGAAAHTATSNTSAWTNVVLSPGQTSSPTTLTVGGVYNYYCQYHVSFDMWGSITVSGTIPEFSGELVVVIGLMAMMLGLMVLRTRRSPR